MQEGCSGAVLCRAVLCHASRSSVDGAWCLFLCQWGWMWIPEQVSGSHAARVDSALGLVPCLWLVLLCVEGIRRHLAPCHCGAGSLHGSCPQKVQDLAGSKYLRRQVKRWAALAGCLARRLLKACADCQGLG